MAELVSLGKLGKDVTNPNIISTITKKMEELIEINQKLIKQNRELSDEMSSHRKELSEQNFDIKKQLQDQSLSVEKLQSSLQNLQNKTDDVIKRNVEKEVPNVPNVNQNQDNEAPNKNQNLNPNQSQGERDMLEIAQDMKKKTPEDIVASQVNKSIEPAKGLMGKVTSAFNTAKDGLKGVTGMLGKAIGSNVINKQPAQPAQPEQP